MNMTAVSIVCFAYDKILADKHILNIPGCLADGIFDLLCELIQQFNGSCRNVIYLAYFALIQ